MVSVNYRMKYRVWVPELKSMFVFSNPSLKPQEKIVTSVVNGRQKQIGSEYFVALQWESNTALTEHKWRIILDLVSDTYDFDVMPCTGYVDGNGDDIYYGDIVRFDTGLVVALLQPEDLFREVFQTVPISCLYESFVTNILGNIHENPELLDGCVARRGNDEI